jgi:hypothetical protein
LKATTARNDTIGASGDIARFDVGCNFTCTRAKVILLKPVEALARSDVERINSF